MKIENAPSRLGKFWGKVDRKHVQALLPFVRGPRVLDLGAGYGTTTNYLKLEGFDAIAIDYDEGCVEIAKQLHPGIPYMRANAEELPFPDSSFDSVVLRDSLHHLVGEADFFKVKAEISRVLRKGGALIVMDPNVNLVLRVMRTLARHQDEECSFEQALKFLSEEQFVVTHKSFNTLFSLPLSGGYVGINFVPPIEWLQRFILSCEAFLEHFVQNSLGRAVAWRYLISATKPL